MDNIPIKKNKSSNYQVPKDLKVDLRNEKIEQKQPSNRWLFLSIILFIIIIILVTSWLFLSSKKTHFTDLLPEETIVFSTINQDILYPQISPFSWFLEENNFFGQKAISSFNKYLNNAGINFKSDIQLFFEKDIAFILLSSNSEVDFPFALVLKRKDSMAQISQILDKIEPEFKKDYNFSSQNYRQMEITSLKSFSPSPYNYAYAQVGDYFVISNSQDCLKNIIDNIIGR